MARETAGVGVKPSPAWTQGLDAVGRQHLERHLLGRDGGAVRVLAQKQRPGDAGRAGGNRTPPG